MPSPSESYVTLARILRPRGIKGEVSAEILTDFPERFLKLREVFLSAGDDQPRKARLRRAWFQGDRVILHFEGCDSMNDAEKFRNLEVQIPLSQRMPLEKGRYYVSDLAGCAVFEKSAPGAALGTVRDVQFGSGPPLLVVDTPRGELLIPLAEDICTLIDTAARRIEVVLPEGLLELNAGSSRRHPE